MTAKKTQRRGMSRPPKPQSADEFIGGASAHPPAEAPAKAAPAAAEAPAEGYPWNAVGVRPDVRKLFNIRLTEPEYLKLKWLAERSPESMHEIAHAAVTAEIERRIAAVTGAQDD